MKLFSLRMFSLSALFTAALVVGAQSAQALLIDSFDQDQTEVTDSSDTAGGVAGSTDTVLVGTELNDPERQIFVEVTGANTGVKEIRGGIDGGVYAHSQESGARGYSTLTYTGFGSANLATNGALGVVMQVIESDLGGNAILSLTDGGGATGTQTLNIPDVTFGSPQTLTFLFADFAPNVNVADITKVILEIDGRDISSLDVTVDFIGGSAVPEPSSLLLLGSGILGLAWLRRKQKNS